VSASAPSSSAEARTNFSSPQEQQLASSAASPRQLASQAAWVRPRPFAVLPPRGVAATGKSGHCAVRRADGKAIAKKAGQPSGFTSICSKKAAIFPISAIDDLIRPVRDPDRPRNLVLIQRAEVGAPSRIAAVG
jgi:hypothetical protein